MTETENTLLSLILSEWARVTLMDPAQKPREGFYDWKARQAAITNLDRLGVVVNPKWLGSDPAGRQARSRALASLVADGWLVKTTIHRRLTYVRPTDAAIDMILQATEVQAEKPPPEPAWVLPPTPITAAELDAALAFDPALDRMLADDAASLDALLASLPAVDAAELDAAIRGSEPPQ